MGDSKYPLMLKVLEQSRKRLEFLLCGYALMPDHWHALTWPQYPLLISEVLHDVKKIAALRLHSLRRDNGPVWQHRFWDRFVRQAKEFNDRLTYMHFNPVRRGLVNRPEEWRWSSYQNFSLEKSARAACPITIDPVLLPDSYRG